MNIGAPACGMNAAVRSFVRLSLTQGYRVLGIQDSFDGLIAGHVSRFGFYKLQCSNFSTYVRVKLCHSLAESELRIEIKKIIFI